jgi:hypothetical protein
MRGRFVKRMFSKGWRMERRVTRRRKGDKEEKG